MGVSTGTSPSPADLLRFWPWVDEAQLASIASGTFEINHLPKLLRYTEGRHKFTSDSATLQINLNKGRQKVVSESTLLMFFPYFYTFLSAFSIYAVFCSAF